jgi:NTP pyrophosphatase (non-canonical NTP hydrolase)
MKRSSIEDVVRELNLARDAYPEFNSAHEGYAVLKEEVDELWDEIKKKPSQRDPEALRKEAIQVAAMALRFLEDVCE